EPDAQPTKTALFASDEEAFAAAEETYRAYTDALNKVDTSDPRTFEPMFSFTSGEFLAADKKTFSELHAEHLTTIGEMKVVDFVGLSAEPPFDEVLATVCVDVSETDVVDKSGLSQVSESRSDMNALKVTFVSTSDGLLINHASRYEEARCLSQ